MNAILPFIFQILFVLAMLWAALTDFCRFRIFNKTIITLIIGFVLFTALNQWLFNVAGLTKILWHFAAAFLALCLFFVFFMIGQMGAGDVKLIAATVLWFGWHETSVQYVLYSLIAGGILTILLYAWRKFPLSKTFSHFQVLRRLHIRKLHTPYGISLGAVAIWCSFQSSIFAH